MLELKDIHINHPIQLTGHFIAKKGTVTFICGENGIGKTTLFYQLTTLQPLECEYYFQGSIIKNNDGALSKFRRKYLGIVLQNDDLNNEMTLKYYIKLYCQINKISENDVYQYTKQFHLFLSLQQKVSELSAGEKIRLSISLALAKDPQILAFDEPTAALDDMNVDILKKILLEKKKDKIICIITHDPRLMCLADCIYDIQDKKVQQRC